MRVGRPQKADPGTLHAFAHEFYWTFRRLAEGTLRWKFDHEKFRQLTEGLENIPPIDDEDRTRHQRIVDEEIQTGRLEASRREERLRDVADGELFMRREQYRMDAAAEARKEIKVRGEPDVVKVLLDTNSTPEQIRELCKQALMKRTIRLGSETTEVDYPAWPIPVGSMFPTYLAEFAEDYVAALHDPRFPRCDVSRRPTNRLKQFWFLSRALAGALYGVKTRTVINLVGSLRPEQAFHESRDGKPARKRARLKYKARI
jgi:hypothetical protein